MTQTDRTVHTFCRLCEVMCGLELTVNGGEITKVRGDQGHPVSQGFACNKGLLSLEVHRDPDRLDHPLVRTDDGWQRRSWSEALDEVAGRLRSVMDRHGPDSVALYLGNPNAFNCAAGPAAVMFLLSLGSTRLFSAATQDCANKFTVGELLYGSPAIHPIPDLARTDHLLVIGSNPRISKTSFLSVPDPVAALRSVVERGGAVTFVNPLRIEPDIGPTVQIRPDTDAFLLAAMLHRIDATVGFRVHGYGDGVDGLDRLRAWVTPYTPAAVAPVVGLAPGEIEALADGFAGARTASVHASTGLNMGRHGTLAYYLVQVLSLVTGNLDRPGGNVVPARAISARPADLPLGPESMEDTPWGPIRRSGASLPGALLPEYVRYPDTPIRALISVAGNPALSFAGADAVDEALRDLDLLVSIDMYRNATGELAHVVLPATDWFERADLNVFTQGTQVVPHVQWTGPVVEPRGERRTEPEIFAALADAMGMPAVFGPDTDPIAAINDGELAAHGLSVAELAARDRGLAVLEPIETGTLLAGGLRTPDGRLDAAPALSETAFERAAADFETMGQEAPDTLRLITRRTRNTLNSAFANVERLKDRGASSNPLWMHPVDAQARGLAAGERARIHNETGTIEAAVAFDPNLREGVVAMTHGFGPAATPAMTVAQAYPGVNVNVLAPSGPGSFDPLSGMAHLTGIVVTVEPASSPAVTSSAARSSRA
ncbi:MAG: molybdopterin-dependent oxidoreductase [Acidimicrobiales bacterium]